MGYSNFSPKILEFLTHVMQLQQYCPKALRMVIPYVIITNQLIATAWFSGEEKYKELYEINKEMTKWMVLNFDKISFEQEGYFTWQYGHFSVFENSKSPLN